MTENITILQNSHYINRMLIAISSVKIVYWPLIFLKFYPIYFFILWSCLLCCFFGVWFYFLFLFFFSSQGQASRSSHINLTNPSNKDFFSRKILERESEKLTMPIWMQKMCVLFLFSLLAISTYWPVFWVVDYKTLQIEK